MKQRIFFLSAAALVPAMLVIACGDTSEGQSSAANGGAGGESTVSTSTSGDGVTTSTTGDGVTTSTTGDGVTTSTGGTTSGTTASSSTGGTTGASTSSSGGGTTSSSSSTSSTTSSSSSTSSTSSSSGGSTGCGPSFIASDPKPIGWASQNGGTTGGGTATPITVTSLGQLQAAAAGTAKAVIYVTGNLAKGTVNIGSNKTIIGCAGKSATLNGHVDIHGSTNVILRNLNIVGYNCAPPDVDTSNGGQCQNGQDAVTIQSAKNIWIDHTAISDGSDGNLDIVDGSDFITVSYTKFFYSTKRSDPNDTGAKGHRYSNLIGNSDTSNAVDSGHLGVTWHHDWWGQNVVERQPRVRFGKNHLFNNLWTSSGDDYCIGVGVSANIRTENNVFSNVKTPIDTSSYSDSASAVKSTGNLYSGSGSASDLRASSVFTPPYTYTPEAASAVQADVEANAGPH